MAAAAAAPSSSKQTAAAVLTGLPGYGVGRLYFSDFSIMVHHREKFGEILET